MYQADCDDFMCDFSNDYIIINNPNILEMPAEAINVEVNGVKYSISNTSPKTSINEWIRSQPGLKGNAIILCFALLLLAM